MNQDREDQLLKLLGMTREDKRAILDEAARLTFGTPLVWPDDDTGLTITRGSDISPKQIQIPPRDHPLMVAARTAFPRANEKYWAMIVHRYRDMYQGIPEKDAVRVIRAGYSSPQHAMDARKLKRRPLVGVT
jgi:hypothetical protein